MDFANDDPNNVIDKADTAWVLSASALLMLMTPALGFIYAGLVRQKSALTILIQSYAIFATVTVVWSFLGFSLSYGDTILGIIGDFKYACLNNLDLHPLKDTKQTIPSLLSFFFQLGACTITTALITGAPAERMALLPSMAFSAIWVLVVYAPVCHWVWAIGGWLRELGSLDFGGSIVVHITSGFAALALACAMRPRREPGRAEPKGPHNMTYVVLGGALIWFAWLGGNGGSALKANDKAALAIVSTNLSAAAAALTSCLTEYVMKKRVTALGVVGGSICGLVAVSAGCGFCPASAALITGAFAGVASNLTGLIDFIRKQDDALDVFGCHAINGIIGALITGLLAKKSIGGHDGLVFGNSILMLYQVVAVVAVSTYSFVATYIIGVFGRKLWQVTEEIEETGLDQVVLQENAYAIEAYKNPYASEYKGIN